METTATTSTRSSAAATGNLRFCVPDERDLNALADIDLKTYPWNWTTDTWSVVLQECCTSIGFDGDLPISLGVIQKQDDETWVIGKIAVKAEYRRRGIGTSLLLSAMGYARLKGAMRVITVLPERWCYPGDHDLTPWLKKHGFRSTTIVHNHFTIDGETEDGIVFERWL